MEHYYIRLPGLLLALFRETLNISGEENGIADIL